MHEHQVSKQQLVKSSRTYFLARTVALAMVAAALGPRIYFRSPQLKVQILWQRARASSQGTSMEHRKHHTITMKIGKQCRPPPYLENENGSSNEQKVPTTI